MKRDEISVVFTVFEFKKKNLSTTVHWQNVDCKCSDRPYTLLLFTFYRHTIFSTPTLLLQTPNQSIRISDAFVRSSIHYSETTKLKMFHPILHEIEQWIWQCTILYHKHFCLHPCKWMFSTLNRQSAAMHHCWLWFAILFSSIRVVYCCANKWRRFIYIYVFIDFYTFWKQQWHIQDLRSFPSHSEWCQLIWDESFAISDLDHIKISNFYKL